jgi:hypothetical protein
MALYGNVLAGACEAQLRFMSEFQGNNYAFTLSRKNGTLQAITSPYNLQATGAEVLDLGDQRGKIKKSRVVYSQRTLHTEARTGNDGINASHCDTAETVQDKEAIVDISNRIATRTLKFTEKQLQEQCENPQAFMQKYILQELAAGREALDIAVGAAISANAGPIIGEAATTAAGTPKSVKLITVNGTTTERTPVFTGYNTVLRDYQNMELNGLPILIGQGVLDEYFQLQNLACCNSTTPFGEAVSRANAAFFLDQHMTSILGAINEFLVIAPGSTMLLTYNENTAININTETVRHYTLPDPEVPGLMWDIDFKWDDCEKAYVWMASVWWDIFNTFQADSFSSPDRLRGMTGIFNYLATGS